MADIIKAEEAQANWEIVSNFLKITGVVPNSQLDIAIKELTAYHKAKVAAVERRKDGRR